jgi:hypothetical protein
MLTCLTVLAVFQSVPVPPAPPAAQGQVADSVARRAAAVAAAIPDTGAARAAGFARLGFGRVTDLSPFQGQHWVHRARLLSNTRGLDQPSFVMFVPVGEEWRRVGLAYSERIGHGDPTPSDLAGLSTPWHLHQLCLDVPGEGGALADGVDDCRARGGRPTPRQLAMVHAWTDVPNPEGPYAHDNVALPYLAAGLAHPTRDEMADSDRARRARALGLALGETYGARMPYARRVEHTSRLAALADSLEAHRAALRGLVPLLREAERAGDAARRAELGDRAIASWESLRALYESAAPTPEIRAQLARQHRAALGEGHGAGHRH